MTTGKTTALTRWAFVDKVMSLLLNMLSRLVITFLPRSKCLLISWLQPPSAVILQPRKIVSHYFYCFPIYLQSIYCPHVEKAMATHSSTLAWKIPWVEEPDRLQSMGSLRVGHD